jgi:hypothetical protein
MNAGFIVDPTVPETIFLTPSTSLRAPFVRPEEVP